MIGINDDGSPNSNFSFGKETFQKWVNEIKVKTQPSIIPDIEVIAYNGKNVVELAIPEFPIKPVSFKGRYFKRVKNSNHHLSVIEIADLSLQSLQVSWDSYPAPNITIDDIDLLKVEKFIRKVNATGRFNLEGSLVENLEKLRLISNNKITNAAYLLFAKRDIAFNVHLGRFKTPSYIIDDKMLRGSLFEVVEETMKYLISQIKVAFEITGVTTQRTEIFEYPLPALRELVLNALIQRDYLSPIDVQIKVFDNSITFFNPGKLYGELTVAHLISNNYQAYARNKLLAEAFYLTGDIEKYGSGFKRIQNELKQYPTMNMDCQEIPNGFLVELSYTQQKTTTRISTENSASAEISGQGAKSGTKSGTKDGTKDGTKKQIDSKMDLIIDLLKESKHVTIDNISKMLNIPRRTIVRYLEKLKNDNVIQRTGSKKDGYWEIL